MANRSKLPSCHDQYKYNDPIFERSRFLSLKYGMFIKKIVIFNLTFERVWLFILQQNLDILVSLTTLRINICKNSKKIYL